jgi:hypothetical protein
MSKDTRDNYTSVAIDWQTAMKITQYKTMFFVGLFVTIAMVTCLPAFFHVIQIRSGVILHDPIVDSLPAYDLSIPVFLVLWSVISLSVLRAFQSPQQCILTVYSILFLLTLRYISVSLVALDPPARLIPLRDPLSNLTYGHKNYITKDLFFSGHTSSMFICFLLLNRKPEKIFALCATVAIAIFVLIQHVHYTIDVIAAPFFTYLAYRLSKKVTQLG